MLGLHLEHPGLVGGEGRGEFVEAHGEEVLFEALDHFVDLLLLGLFYALAGEDGPPGVGVDGEATGALDEGGEPLAGAYGIDAGVGDLTVDGHLLVELPVGNGADEDIVVHLERYVVDRVALQGGAEADLYPRGLGSALGDIDAGYLGLVGGVVEQAACPMDDIADPGDPLDDGELARFCHGAGDVDDALALHHREEAEVVAVLEGHALEGIPRNGLEVALEHGAVLPVYDAHQLDTAPEAGGGHAAGYFDEVVDADGFFHFIYGGTPDVARDGHLGADGGDEDDVLGHEANVLGLVALHEEVVEVEVGDDLAAALDLDVPHGAAIVGTARDEQGVDQGGEGGDGVAAGFSGVTHDIDLDVLEGAEGDAHLVVGVEAGELLVEHVLELLEVEARHADDADAGDGYGAVAADGDGPGALDHAPDVDADLVTGADDVVGTDRGRLVGREGGRGRAEEFRPVAMDPGQLLLGEGPREEALELGHAVGGAPVGGSFSLARRRCGQKGCLGLGGEDVGDVGFAEVGDDRGVDGAGLAGAGNVGDGYLSAGTPFGNLGEGRTAPED